MNVGSRKFQLTLSVGPQYDNFSIAKARPMLMELLLYLKLKKAVSSLLEVMPQQIIGECLKRD